MKAGGISFARMIFPFPLQFSFDFLSVVSILSPVNRSECDISSENPLEISGMIFIISSGLLIMSGSAGTSYGTPAFLSLCFQFIISFDRPHNDGKRNNNYFRTGEEKERQFLTLSFFPRNIFTVRLVSVLGILWSCVLCPSITEGSERIILVCLFIYFLKQNYDPAGRDKSTARGA